MKTIASFLIVLFLLTISVQAQEKITFSSTDGLTITADLYQNDAEAKFVLLFHQAGYSRGEYANIGENKGTAYKIGKIGYNCLAVDLRSGKEVNYVQNETASLADKKGMGTSYLDAEKDIIAAIEYAYQKSQKPVILLGSSYSASLVFKVAKGNEKVEAVIGFSPGEYFKTDGITIKDELSGFKKPFFAASSVAEFTYMKEMFANAESTEKTLFRPQKGGQHGSKCLWKEFSESREYWFDLMQFLNKFKN